MRVVKGLKRLEPSDLSFLANRYQGAEYLKQAVKAAHSGDKVKARTKLRKADKNIALVPIGGRPAEVIADALMAM